MIKSITFENFFSFREPTTIELNAKVNILVGINGSGKSNFLKAIRFLYESISGIGVEKIFLRDWGGFNAVANFNESKADTIKLIYIFDCNILNYINKGKGHLFTSNLVYEISIHKAGVTSYYLAEKLYNEGEEEDSNQFLYLKMDNGMGIISTIEDNQNKIQHYPQTDKGISFKGQELVLRQISDPYRFLPLYTLKLAIDSIAVYDYFDTTPGSRIRQNSFDGIETRLLFTGENLVQILSRIKNHHSLQYEEIETLLTKVNPNFKDINFDKLGNNFYLTLREKKLAQTVGIAQISDGTLRYLLLLSILLNPERGGLVTLDEPEIGLHPDMINTIAEAIKKASGNHSQLIIATHSPQLLNSFDIDDVLVFEKDDNNKTIVTRKTEEDFEDWNDNFLVGQLWLRGKIGGKRW
jgi:predicted ATPase